MKKAKNDSRFGVRLALTYVVLILSLNVVLLVAFVVFFGNYIDHEDLEKTLNRLVLKTSQRFQEPGFSEAYRDGDEAFLQGRMRYLGSFEDSAGLTVYYVLPKGRCAYYEESSETAQFMDLPTRYEAAVEAARKSGHYEALPFFNGEGYHEFIRAMTVYSPLGEASVMLVSSPLSYLWMALAPVCCGILFSGMLSAAVAVLIAIRYAAKLNRSLNGMRSALDHWKNQEFAGADAPSGFVELNVLGAEMDEVAERLGQSAVRRAEFFSNVSHELKTPVASIRAQAELLTDGLADTPEEQQSYYHSILRETENLQHLVEDMLLLTHLQSPQYTVQYENCAPQGILEDAVRCCRPLAQKKQQTLTFLQEPLAPENAVFRCNYTRLRQLFVIFIENAIKYTECGKAITVRLYDSEAGAIAEICDQGAGISPEDQKHIFDYRVRVGADSGTAGEGIGLALAEEIAALLGIKISLESELLKGTTVRLLLKKKN